MNNIVLSSLLIALTSACGIQDDAHYDNKTFGRNTSTAPLSETPQPGPATVPAPTPEPVRTPDVTPAPTDEPPASSGHDLLGYYAFVGYFDSATLGRMVRGKGVEGEVRTDAIYDPMLRSLFGSMTSDESQETLEIATSENGPGRQKVIQSAHTANGDFLSAVKGEDSQSGSQMLDWSLSTEGQAQGECPSQFICVDRITWRPENGASWTYCFRDMQTNQLISVPYAPNTQFGPEAFRGALPSGQKMSKPFTITKHPGVVMCTDKNIETRERRQIQWRATIGDLRASREVNFLKKAVHKPLTPDSEILLEFRPWNAQLKRWWQPKDAPFIDQMSRFNSKMRYFLNSKDHVFVKIIQTAQTPLNAPLGEFLNAVKDAYRGTPLYYPIAIAIDAMQLLFPTDNDTVGLQVNYQFEFCTHKALVPNAFNHCTGKTAK